jgi:hypothetical protein
MAWTAIKKLAKRALLDLQDQERLFGDAAEMPKPYTPESTVLVAAGIDEESPPDRLDLIVANYLTNVRDYLMDATGMFYDFEEDED